MDLRSLLGSLQLPIAGIGALLAGGACVLLVQLLPIPDQGGLPAGLALVVLYVLAWVGFLLLSLGLLIPPGEGIGIHFSRGQRVLFGFAAGGALLSAVLPFVAFGLLLTLADSTIGPLLVLAWLGPAAIAVLALAGGLGWRGAQAVASRMNS